MDPRVVLGGLIVGMITGLSGIGGSSLLAPVLILLLSVKPALAVGTDLAYSVPTKLLAAFVHARQGTVDRALTIALAAGGIPGALAGLVTFGTLRAGVPTDVLQSSVRHAIGGAIACACVMMVVLYLRRQRAPSLDAAIGAARWKAVAIGFVVGVLVAITSIGSGSVTLPLLLLAFPAFGARRLIGSEIAFAAIIVPLAAAGHATFGNVDWRLAGNLLAGSLPGVYLGSTLCTRIDERPLRAAILVVLAYAAYRLL